MSDKLKGAGFANEKEEEAAYIAATGTSPEKQWLECENCGRRFRHFKPFTDDKLTCPDCHSDKLKIVDGPYPPPEPKKEEPKEEKPIVPLVSGQHSSQHSNTSSWGFDIMGGVIAIIATGVALVVGYVMIAQVMNTLPSQLAQSSGNSSLVTITTITSGSVALTSTVFAGDFGATMSLMTTILPTILIIGLVLFAFKKFVD